MMVLKQLAFLLDYKDLPQELVYYLETHYMERERKREARILIEGTELNPHFP